MFSKSITARALLVLAASTLGATQTFAQRYQQNNLVSDGSVPAAQTDPNLLNAWGLSRSSAQDWWVSDNASGKSTLYDGSGKVSPLVVTIPAAKKGDVGSPTGTIFNGTAAFQLTPGNPSQFLYATEDGTISGWNAAVDLHNAIVKVKVDGAVYKGITAARAHGKMQLYVANFHSGQIEVYDSQFNRVKLAPHAFSLEDEDRFRDGRGPWEAVPQRDRDQCFAKALVPYNVQNIGGALYVAFAQQDAARHDSVSGAGLGLVAAFDLEGRLIRVFEPGAFLNAPWGIALAPGDFGAYSHALLIGQFGNGKITAYNATTGKYIGTLQDSNGRDISIDGLWGISFGSSTQATGPFNSLYFGAGPGNEGHGLFGSLTPVPESQLYGNDL